MDVFLKKKIPAKTLRQLNYCRLYLRVEQLSDITTGDRTRISESHLTGTRINQWTSKTWPIQGNPNRLMWKQLEKHITESFPRGQRLQKTLGAWMNPITTNKWWYHTISRQIVHNDNDCWRIHSTTIVMRRMSSNGPNKQVINYSRHLIPLPECIQDSVGLSGIPASTRQITRTNHLNDWNTKLMKSWDQYVHTHRGGELSPLNYPAITQAKLAENLWIVTDGGVIEDKS